jgi:hypothetical protein
VRNPPPAAWILSPLVLAGLYALLHGLFAPVPDLEDLAPEDAMVVFRFKDLDAYDALSLGPRAPGGPTPRERMAALRNLPALEGVSRKAPVHEVWLPLPPLRDETMVILPIEDADALQAHFDDVGRIEKGQMRHAQRLVRHGPFAAIGAHLDALRRVGEGGLTCPPDGEDLAIAVRLDALAAFALQRAADAPWRGILETLGLDLAGMRMYAAGAERQLEAPRAERLRRIVDAWETARFWAWTAERRIRLELTLRAGSPVEPLLRAAHDAPAEEAGRAPRPPVGADAHLLAESGAARRLLASALFHGGVPFLEEPEEKPAEGPADETSLLGGLGDPAEAGKGPLLAFTTPSGRGGTGWLLCLVAEEGALPDLSAFLAGIPEDAGSAPLPEGAVPLLLAAPRADGRPSPAGEIARESIEGGRAPLEALALGPGAAEAIREARLEALKGEAPPPPETRPGWRRVATFSLSEPRAANLMREAMEPGGLLAVFRGGSLSGEVWTDGRVLRIEARAR